MRIIVILGLVTLVVAKNFRGDQVLTLFPTTYEHVKAMQNLENVRGLADFWSPQYASHVKPNRSVDIRFPREHLTSVKRSLRENELNYKVKIEELQSFLDEQLSKRQVRQKRNSDTYDYDVYHTYEEINEWTSDIAAQYSDKITRMVLGSTYEGRDIPTLKISTSDNNPIMFIECGFHAREWISPAFCQCYVHKLMEQYRKDPDITAAVNGLTFYIAPVLNPDGYAYSWTDNRMWRKTRSNYRTACYGVDPNRNFQAGWASAGEDSSNDPCSETYHGPYAQSEVEVQALSDFIKAQERIKAYISIHSYSQTILYPYAYKTDPAPHQDQLKRYAAAASVAVKTPYNTVYQYGQTTDILYLAPGGSDDYAYENGATLSYTVELRDRGRYGFLLPEDQIGPTCIETTNMLKVFTDAAMAV